MIDVKRIGYLFGLALALGLLLVHFRTNHFQSMYEMTCLAEQEKQLRERLCEQQALLSARMERPKEVKERVSELNLSILPPGLDLDDKAKSKTALQEDDSNEWTGG